MAYTNTLWKMRMASLLYFVLLVTYIIIDTNNGDQINWPFMIIGFLLIIQLIINFRIGDVLAGGIFAVISCYMMMAVTSDLIDHFNGSKPVSTFWSYFGFGYGIFGTAFVSSILLLYSDSARKRNERTLMILANRK